MDSTLRRNARGPSVHFEANSDGSIDATFECYRVKTNGDYENIVVVLNDLSVDQVACVGRGARRAISHAKKLFADRAGAAYDRVITPGA